MEALRFYCSSLLKNSPHMSATELPCRSMPFLVVSLIRISGTLHRDVEIHGHSNTGPTTVLTWDAPCFLARLRAHRRSLDCGIARSLALLARSYLLAPA